MIKSLDNFKIVYDSGTSFDMADDLSILVRSLIIGSPKPVVYRERLEGRDGDIFLGRDLQSRSITAVCNVSGSDYANLNILLTNLSRTIYAQPSFYIIADSNPLKRWRVAVESDWSPEKVGAFGEFTLKFETISPFAEGVSGNVETRSTTAFSINNPGDVVIDPRQHDLVITYTGASTNLKITNSTNGDAWQYTGSSSAGNTVVLDGVRSFKNGLSIYRNTSRKLIRLQPGTNNFTLTGTSGSFTIKFEFRSRYN